MKANNAIEVKGVSKSFNVVIEGGEGKRGILSKFGRETKTKDVLKEVSFEVKKGEVVGILGRNGSGKSTLLKMIARIMDPDIGTIEVSGKAASILELGMGFHPDMSGRENIYLKGELYGFSRKEIDSRIEDIIAYSGIGESINNPVRTYSSGMSGRLAFAIMVNVEADVMIVDEVLSTGDSTFSMKASEHFKKMARSGKTVLFVSHNINMIESMCTRVIWIEDGVVRRDGPAKKICAEYNLAMSESPEIMVDLAEAGVPDAQYKLAKAYHDGVPFGKDSELYEYWLEKASTQGHVLAQVGYADLLFSKTDEESKDLAISLYQSAAIRGNNEARIKLSSLHSVDYKEYVCEMISAYMRGVEQEDPVAEYRCADLILKTAWTNDDRVDAFKMFKNSADHGYPIAMHQLALMYRDGIGTTRDVESMTEYMERASSLGNMNSILMLADMYWNGNMIPKDDRKAFDLYLEGAILGNGRCMYQVAMMLRDGVGVEPNAEESDYWFSLFSDSAMSQHFIWVCEYLDRCDANYQTNLEKYYVKSMRLNNLNSASMIVNMTNAGWNNSSCYEEALMHLINSASNGNVDAIKRVANIFYDGNGTDCDYNVAASLYVMASKLGDSWSKLRLADMYRSGKVDGRNRDDAITLYIDLMRSGNTNAMGSLISMYASGEGVDDDVYAEACKTLSSVAKTGSVDACKRMGNMYHDATGITRDYHEAALWYEGAANMGDSWSKSRLADLYKNKLNSIEKSVYWFQK